MSKTTLTFIVFFFTAFVYGQNQPKTLLWKVTKKGNKNVSYLFGTFHEVTPLFFSTLSNAVNKLHQSDILFVEQRSCATAKFTLGETWTCKRWKAILTNEQEKVFTSFLKKAEDTSYYKLNPLLLSLTMARLYLVNFCEVDSNFTELMDNYIEDIAIRANKHVYSLDTDQNTLLNKTSENLTPQQDSEYASFGIEYMKSMLDNNLADCKIVTAYKNFSIDYQLDKEITQQSSDFLLLINRNNSWISVLSKSFSTNSCFVAVGFRHLFYKQGLIQKLRNLGYSVVPIPVRI